MNRTVLTVSAAATKAGKAPETIRRWIRNGDLYARKIGGQYMIEEPDLEALLDVEQFPLPAEWGMERLPDGRPMPNIVAILRRQRAGH